MPYPLPDKIHQILTPTGQIVGDIPDISDEQLIELYRWMVLGRICSDRMVALQRQGRLGTLAAINGQEAASVGLAALLEPEDWLTGSYREILAYMVKGIPISTILGYYRGYLHEQAQFPYETRCLPIQIVLATQILHATGIAMGIKYESKPQVVVGVCGDGATSEGDFNEALNFAGVYQAPMIFVVQNNGWAISTPRHKQSNAQYIAHRGPGFGLPSYIVDGNDLLAVYQVMREVIERARSGGGPSLVECLTYRLAAHTTADDPTKYQPDEELQQWLSRDPIPRFRQFLQNRNLLTDEQDQQLEADCRAEVQAGVSALNAMPAQPPESIFDLVYETPTPQLQRQKADYLHEMGGVKNQTWNEV
ncbi:pyruvate dehydrogenase (acetyl-transferring) E1 component subunit alpha [Anaerolineales bacterium HSG25]|nr:pyruvate dehydrogenase (acetyl-transferring) E1 component subunit alpha [Anaerolineales bacterium HSG25]